MRQIKFREWLGKEFHYWGFLRDGAFIGPSDPKGIHNQFTGLLDKNGKEIYEGDIVSAWSDGYNHKGYIRWMLSGMPRIIIYPAFANQGFWVLHGSERKDGDILIDVTGKLEFVKGTQTTVIDDGVEIIGNIYESPDLLK